MEDSLDRLRPGSLDLASSFPRALGALESAVTLLQDEAWEEGRRKRAHVMATALVDAAKQAGWKETAATLGALASLLALPAAVALSIQDELRRRLPELLGLLRKTSNAKTG